MQIVSSGRQGSKGDRVKPLFKYGFCEYGSVNKQWGGVVYRSWAFGFDSGIPRVTISGRSCDWTGSSGLHRADWSENANFENVAIRSILN
ncbi:hypothetical protein GQ457_11G032120 [Hibiscus cannabinus]